jgi:hypothetical protein
LEGGDLAEAVLIIGAEAKTLLVPATSELRAVFTEGTEYSAELGALARNADFIAFTQVSRIPIGALPIPGAFSQAYVPGWLAK